MHNAGLHATRKDLLLDEANQRAWHRILAVLFHKEDVLALPVVDEFSKGFGHPLIVALIGNSPRLFGILKCIQQPSLRCTRNSLIRLTQPTDNDISRDILAAHLISRKNPLSFARYKIKKNR